ncbi:alcohol dehydrogenase catalytic domain-containing protein [Rhodococcus rhodochrous]|uniref:alcohol dehydrogenase catalytic domain-containing protein n=1 Tax=Rhodococcus rhodochrous TaxID=1829 RepID=UPI001E306E38|nr:alcohol dehydrogenase catalytic domain-containing protein [Rhodococcus rhodochrous]MCB8914150.1 alcohol dehydrogenase catalytic domain-containing protein [Rhodococcus rhodochrous]
MKAVTFAGSGTVEVTTVPDPVLVEPTDALVQVHRAAICGTDLHTVAHPDGLDRGAILGHEFTGTVLSVGSAVRTFRPGDRVSGADFTACGHCWWCRAGNHWECADRQFFGTGNAFGPALAGTQAEFVRVPHADIVLHAIADVVSDDSALFFGDILATGYAAVQRCDLLPGGTVAIIGGGPVGQMASLAAQSCGAGPVVLVEPVQDRRTTAKAHGAVVTPPETARELINTLTDGRGADAVIEAVGGPKGLDTAMGLVRRRGTVVSVGVHQQPTWPLPVAQAFADELTMRFAIGNAIRDRDRLEGLVASGAIDPTIVIDQRVALDDAPSAYEAMAQRRTLKAIIDVS